LQRTNEFTLLLVLHSDSLLLIISAEVKNSDLFGLHNGYSLVNKVALIRKETEAFCVLGGTTELF